ncbi:MAG: N-acetylmuramoyl-L-alanine amidase [Blautia sp.]|nr:N-acetylmuramoyl-L-alanine amidase [Blautia sp.]
MMMRTAVMGEGMLSAPSEDNESIFSANVSAEQEIGWDESWQFADYSKIHTGTAVLHTPSQGNGIVVCVNAGHGTSGGDSVKTLCHPDGSPKVTGGSTAEGATYATAVSGGATMADGTSEAAVNLQLALLLKEKLLDAGFSVLMIREDTDVQLDNIARTVIANENAACHLALHYDSTASDKGFFYIGVPGEASYRSMEPVASHWTEHEDLGQHILAGVRDSGYRIFGSGTMEIDLTQTSYSTIPSVDLECGDTASDCSVPTQTLLAEGITAGLRSYFGVE